MRTRDRSTGAQVNGRDATPEQCTPLLRALERESEAAAQYLLQARADVWTADADGTLPLHMAAATCRLRPAFAPGCA